MVEGVRMSCCFDRLVGDSFECFMKGDVFVRKMFLAVGDDMSVYPKKLGHTSLTSGSD